MRHPNISVRWNPGLTVIISILLVLAGVSARRIEGGRKCVSLSS